MNWYDAAQKDYIGAHSDDERQLFFGAPIVSITWTSSPTHFRRFRIKPKNSSGLYPNFGEEPGVISLRDGDVVVMGGMCQKSTNTKFCHHGSDITMNPTGVVSISRCDDLYDIVTLMV